MDISKDYEIAELLGDKTKEHEIVWKQTTAGVYLAHKRVDEDNSSYFTPISWVRTTPTLEDNDFVFTLENKIIIAKDLKKR